MVAGIPGAIAVLPFVAAYPAIALMCGAGVAAMAGRRWRSAHPVGLVLFGVIGLVLIVLLAATATFMPGDLGTDVRRAISAALIGLLIIGGAIGVMSAIVGGLLTIGTSGNIMKNRRSKRNTLNC